MPTFFAAPLARLVQELAKLPGVGPKTAQRLALHLIRRPRKDIESLAEALLSAHDDIRDCSVCCNLTDDDPCAVCRDRRRDRSVIAVVEDPSDVMAMERTREYRGLYHVLHGSLSPMEGIGPDDLRLRELMARLKGGEVREIIVATNPTVEGEATAIYLARLLKPLGVTVTRIARGLPEGGDLEYVDELTLARALQGRREMSEEPEPPPAQRPRR